MYNKIAIQITLVLILILFSFFFYKKYFSQITDLNQKEDSIEIIKLYESEILNNEGDFYDLTYNGSLFGNKKIITKRKNLTFV